MERHDQSTVIPWQQRSRTTQVAIAGLLQTCYPATEGPGGDLRGRGSSAQPRLRQPPSVTQPHHYHLRIPPPPRSVVDGHRDDIRKKLRPPAAIPVLTKFRINGTVMDVAVPYIARQRRLIGTFPQATGFRQWEDGAPTPADGEETAHARRSSEATLIKDVVRIPASPILTRIWDRSRSKKETRKPAAGKAGPTTVVRTCRASLRQPSRASLTCITVQTYLTSRTIPGTSPGSWDSAAGRTTLSRDPWTPLTAPPDFHQLPL